MAHKKQQQQRGVNDELDRMGRQVVRLSAMNETEGEAVAASPFLYARLRSRIKAERQRREEGENWLALLGVIWRAVPALGLVAIFAFALFWSASPATRSTASFSVDSFLDTPEAGMGQVVFADAQPLSSDEVLATILNDDEREAAK